MSILKWILLGIVTIFTMTVAWVVGAALAMYFSNFAIGLACSAFVCWFMGRGVGAELAKYL